MMKILPTTSALISIFDLRGICVMMFVFLIGSTSTFAQATDSGYEMRYRFSIDGITNPSEAEQAITIISDQSFVSGINFIDECDCFKLFVHEPINYEDLADPLKAEQLIISEILYGEDGSELKSGLINELTE